MKRTRVVLDTNVLISALFFGGHPREILEAIIAGTVHCSLSPAILDELRDVLRRPKFGLLARQVTSIVEELYSLCEIASPVRNVRVVKNDPDDDRVIECALEARADAIISGDSHLLEVGTYKGIRILSPSEFVLSGGMIVKRRPRGKR